MKKIKALIIIGLLVAIGFIIIKFGPSLLKDDKYKEDGIFWIDGNGVIVGHKNQLTVVKRTEEEKSERLEEVKAEIEEEQFLQNSSKYFSKDTVVPKTSVNLDITQMTVADFLSQFFETLREKIDAKDENMFSRGDYDNIQIGYIKGIGDLYGRTFYNCGNDDSYTDYTIADKYFIRMANDIGINPQPEVYVARNDLAKYSMGITAENYYFDDYKDFEKEFYFAGETRTDYIETFTDTFESTLKLPNGVLKDFEKNNEKPYIGSDDRTSLKKRLKVNSFHWYYLHYNRCNFITNFQDYWTFSTSPYDGVEYYFGDMANKIYTNEEGQFKLFDYVYDESMVHEDEESILTIDDAFYNINVFKYLDDFETQIEDNCYNTCKSWVPVGSRDDTKYARPYLNFRDKNLLTIEASYFPVFYDDRYGTNTDVICYDIALGTLPDSIYNTSNYLNAKELYLLSCSILGEKNELQ